VLATAGSLGAAFEVEFLVLRNKRAFAWLLLKISPSREGAPVQTPTTNPMAYWENLNFFPPKRRTMKPALETISNRPRAPFLNTLVAAHMFFAPSLARFFERTPSQPAKSARPSAVRVPTFPQQAA